MAKTAVFGGTFNPFHNGHLEIVLSLLKQPHVDNVLIVPTATPPHKEAYQLVSGEDRLNMCLAAVANLENVSVSDIEIKRGGKSYTYDTVCQLKSCLNTDIAITCGADMITGLHTWYRYADLINEVSVIAFRRVGVDGDDFDNAVERLRCDGANVSVIDCDITDISSTRIRNGEFTAVPQPVYEYIMQNNLYGVCNDD